MEKENKNPVEISFKKAAEDYLNKKISDDCLGFISIEFFDNLKYFQKQNRFSTFHNICPSFSLVKHFPNILQSDAILLYGIMTV